MPRQSVRQLIPQQQQMSDEETYNTEFAELTRLWPRKKLGTLLRAIQSMFPDFQYDDKQYGDDSDDTPPIFDEYGRIYPHWYSNGKFTPPSQFEDIWKRRESNDVWGR